MLKWHTQWADKLTITADGFGTVTVIAPAGHYDTFPSAPGNQYAVHPNSTTTYTLEISGPNGSSDTNQVTVSVNGPQPILNLTPNPRISPPDQEVKLTWTTSYAQSGVSLFQRVPGQTDTQPVQVQQQGSDYPPPAQPVEFTSYVMTALGVGNQTTVSVPVVRIAGQLSNAVIVPAFIAAMNASMPDVDWPFIFSGAVVSTPRIAAYACLDASGPAPKARRS